MAKLKMGYIGYGFMAQKVHLPNIAGLQECELVALAEIRPQLRAKAQQRYRIPHVYATHQELACNQDVQAVAVSGDFYGQGQIAIDLLKAGKDVFMEKPMAISIEQGQRIVDAEKASGHRLMVAYMKRYDAGNMLVKRMIDQFRKSGELGPVKFVRNHGFCGDWSAGLDTPLEKTDEKYPETTAVYPPWLPDRWHKGYIGYLQQYTHNVNLVRWFLDAAGDVKVKAVELDSDGIGGVVVLEVGGARTTIESGSVRFHGWEEHTQVYFRDGWIKTDAPPLLLRNVPAAVEIYRGDSQDKALSQLFPAGGREWSYKAEMRHFVDCVQTGKPFGSPASDSLEDVKVFEAVYKRFVEAQD